MSRSVGRFDWWNIKDEHTSWEWAAQLAMYNVSPFGAKREDMRAAIMTANLIASQMDKAPEDEEFAECRNVLMNYLKCDRDTEDLHDGDAIALMKKKEDR